MLKKVCVVAAAAIGLSMIAPAVANASPVDHRNNPCLPCQVVDEEEEGDGDGEGEGSYPTYWDCEGSGGGGVLGSGGGSILAGLFAGIFVTPVLIAPPHVPCD